MFKTIRTHLKDNSGDANVSKMIWVAVTFVVGAILLVLITGAFKGPVKNWYEDTNEGWFDDANGAYISSANFAENGHEWFGPGGTGRD